MKKIKLTTRKEKNVISHRKVLAQVYKEMAIESIKIMKEFDKNAAIDPNIKEVKHG